VAVLAVFVFAAVDTTQAERDANTDVFAVRFQNDLGRAAVLALCKSDHSEKCEHPDYRDGIPEDDVREENVSTDVGTEWAVEDDAGNASRCIVLHFDRYPGRVPIVLLSDAADWANPCPMTRWR
jgi:hypothetical protein